ncbi:MAG: formylglycine-generating enzyme family protein, partial [Verrucomicrobia bacterium]|nr:formylglycine-generating enzyme family protein [Verrucomicrobiota bacterium]
KLFFCAKGETSKNMTIPLSDTVSLDMIRIEPGTFMMGSPEDELGRQDDEVQHQVTLTQGYWLGKYEVTQAQYEAVMGKNPSCYKGADLPVEQVSWNDAVKFCEWLTAQERAAGRLPEGYEYTLPTEAQWEYACRAGTTTAFNNGTNIPTMLQRTDRPCPNLDPLAWYGYNSGEYNSAGNYTGNGKTFPVGQKQPNAWGLYDMHGNVWEWCLDRYGSYPSSAVTDPKGPATGSGRVMRGGSWYFFAYYCRSAYRYGSDPGRNGSNYGFRVALSPVQ